MAYDLTSIKMSVNLGSTAKIVDEYNALIKTLETKHVKLEVDVSSIKASVGLATKEIEKAYKEVEASAKKAREEMEKPIKTTYNKSLIDNTSIDAFKTSIKQLRTDIVDLQSTKVTYGVDDKGIKSVNAAVLTYTDNVGKLVTETMGYERVVDQATGKAEKQWKTLSIVVNENSAALQRNMNDLELFRTKTNFKISENLNTKNIDTTKLSELKEKMDSLDFASGTLKQDIRLLSEEFSHLFKESSRKGENVLGTKTIEEEISRAEKAINKFADMKDKQIGGMLAGNNGALIPNLSEYDTLVSKMNELKNMKIDTTNVQSYTDKVREVTIAYNELVNKTKEVTTTSREMNASAKIDQQLINKVRDYNTQLEIMKRKNADIVNNPLYKSIANDVEKLSQAKQPLTQLSNETNTINNNMKKLNATMSQTGNVGGMFSRLGESVKSAFNFVSLTMVMYKFANQVREIPSVVRELDTSLVELNKVANLSKSELTNFVKVAYQIGEGLGRTGREVTDATTEFVKAGYDMKESTELAKSAMLAMNVGTGMENIEQSTNSLIATLKGFNFEADDSKKVVDSLAKVADTTAIGYSELADGIERVSAVMNQGGTSFQQTLGLLTSTYELSRNIEKSATGINTISQRMRGLKIGDSGELEKDAELMGKVEAQLKSIAGVNLMDNNGQLRSTFDVLQDLSKVYSTLSTNQKQYLTELLAGNRQNVVLSQIMQNWSSVTKSIEATTEATGYSDEVNSRYLDSINGRIASLKSAWEQLATSTLSSDTIKSLVEGLTKLVKMIDSLGGLVPVLTNILGIVILLKREAIVSSISSLITNVKTFTTSLTSLTSNLNAVAIGMRSTASAAAFFNVATGGIGVLLTAMSLLTMATNKAKANAKELVAEQKRLADENRALADTYMNQIDGLNNVSGKYKEIYNTISDKAEKDKALRDLQDELISKYGIEKDKIDLVNGSYQEQIGIINKLIEDKPKLANQLIQDDNQSIWNNFFDASSLFKDEDGQNVRYTLTDEQKKDLENIDSTIKSAFKGGLTKWEEGFDFGEHGVTDYLTGGVNFFQKDMNLGLTQQNYGSVEENMKKTIESYEMMISQMDGTSLDNTDFYNAIKERLNTLQGYYESYTKNIEQINQNNAITMSDTIKKSLGISDFESATTSQINQYIALVKASDNYDDSVKQLALDMAKTNETMDETVNVDDYWGGVKETFKQMNEDTDILTVSLNELNTSMRLSPETIAELAKNYPQLADSMGSTEDAIAGITREINNQKLSKYADSVNELRDNMDKLKDGQILSGKEIADLVAKYPQLASAVTNVNGVYSIELGALEDLSTSMQLNAKKTIEAELRKTKAVLEETRTRIQARIEEQTANAKYSGFNYNEEEDESLQAWYKKQGQYLEAEKSLQEQLDNIDLLLQKGSGSTKSSSKESYVEQGLQLQIDVIKEKREEIAKEISKLQSQIELATTTQGDASPYVQKLRDQLSKLQDAEKSVIQSSADELRKIRDDMFAKLTNGNNYFDGFTSETLTKSALDKALLQIEKHMSIIINDTEINKLELHKSKIEEIGNAYLSAKDSIAELGDEFMDNKMSILDEYISRIQDAISMQESLASDNETEINLRLSVLDETDEGYIEGVMQLQKQLIDNKLALQKSYETEYKKMLNILGNSEADVCKDIKRKWETTQNEILELRKQSNEKYIAYMNSQSSSIIGLRNVTVEMYKDLDDKAKSALDKQMDALEKEADLRKEALEARKDELSAIKEEYDYQNKINDLRQSLSDTMSDLNALEFDDSADAIQAKIELANKAQDEKKALADEEFNHAIELAQSAIDDAIDAIERQTKVQVELLQAQIESLNRSDKEYQLMANAAMLNNPDALKDQLLPYNRESGDGLDATINKLYDAALPIITEMQETKVTIPQKLNDIANAIYALEKENANYGTQLFDGTTLSGNGSEYLNKSLAINGGGISNVVTPVMDTIKGLLDKVNTTPQNVTAAPQVNLYAKGDISNETVDAIKKWAKGEFTTDLIKIFDSLVKGNTTNMAGATK